MALRVVQQDEAELLRAFRDGRREAPTALWRRFGMRIHRLVLRTLGPDDAVEELAQEAFTRVLERVGSVRHEAALEGFVVAVTLNTVRGELRRRRRRRFFSFLFPAEEPLTDDDPSAKLEVKQLFDALDALTVDQRLAFTLRHLEQFELTEVAQAMGVSLATAKRRLVEAKAVLDERFAEPTGRPGREGRHG
ncbi:MAG: sigma-70 family RNA polymerase sigma factor [Myxococcaceae bacterium]|jgi:RNA polymerase sigma-70 factor (ECF subfamily)|nr:sigma-70 family RNA polymerase sigma factor [Myxococcaceae bacterium]MCA3015340.1 sigma-70 family RNA polymerase sigma factor [Myxococcaceae bacterium]